VLPDRTVCPVCRQKQLNVYQDSISSEEWHHCNCCGSSGDLVQLAAAAWNCELEEALARLGASTLPLPNECLAEPRLQAYMRASAYRARVLELWETSRQSLITTNLAHDVRNRLGLVLSMDRERTASGPARLFGTATMQQVERCFQPTAGHNLRQSADRVLPGKDWKSVVVIPYLHGPGRISQYLFVGRQNRPEDRIYKRIWLESRDNWCVQRDDAGLAGLLSVQPQHQHVIASDDVLLMLRLQMRNFLLSTTPLPLVAWLPETMCWPVLNGGRLIFWSVQPTPELIRHLINTDAELALVGPRTDDPKVVAHWLRLKQAPDVERQILERCRPWREAMRLWFKRAPEAELSAFLQAVARQNDPELTGIVAACHPPMSLRLNPLQIRSVRHGVHTYIERSGNLYVQLNRNRDRLLLPGELRVQQVLRRERETVYQGTLSSSTGEPTIEFRWSDSSKTTFKNTLAQAALRQGRSLTVSNHDYLGLGLALSQPVYLDGKSRIGWDGERFWFRACSVQPGRRGVFVHGEDLFTEDAPGPAGVPKLGHELVRCLGRGGVECELLWSLFLCVLQTILAPFQGRVAPVTLICGSYARNFAEAILGRLGVPTKTVHRQTRVDWPHAFPLFTCPARFSTTAWHHWLIAQDLPQLSFVADPASAYALAACSGFQLLHCEQLLHVRRLHRLPLEMLVVAFLRDRLGRGPLETRGELQQALVAWLEELGADSTAAQQCDRWYRCQPADAVLQVLSGLFARGLLKAGGRNTTRETAVPFDPESLLVSHAAIRRCYAAAEFAPPELAGLPDPLRLPRQSLLPT
jgi:hypothetical protein